MRKFERLGINAERMREEEDMMGTHGAVDELEPLEHEVETHHYKWVLHSPKQYYSQEKENSKCSAGKD
jgi:hypothetical protein